MRQDVLQAKTVATFPDSETHEPAQVENMVSLVFPPSRNAGLDLLGLLCLIRRQIADHLWPGHLKLRA